MTENTQPVFTIEKLYVRDLSLEVPNAPKVFLERENPQINVQLRNDGKQIDEGVYEVVLTVTVTAKIGEGGMGEVYLADHALLKRPTAVKLLPPEKVGERAILRFEREVQQLSRLTHPNTVSIFDFGRTPSRIFYYAMEYLDGLDLEELI